MIIRKFYDTAVAEIEGSGGTEAAVIEQPSIAEMLAKHGTKNSSAELIAPPIQIQRTDFNNTEKKEEPIVTNAEKTVETTTPSNEAAASPESQKPVEQAKVEEQQITETTQPAQTWQEVLTSQQPDTVLKALGFDDQKVKFFQRLKEVDPKMIAFLDKWENKEDVTSYLKELTTDYTKMPPGEVMRHQLREEYPTASEAAINALYKKKIVEAYNLNSEDEAEALEGKMILEAEADRYRAKMITNQQGKLLPNPPEAKAPPPDLQAEKAQQEFEAYKSTMTSNSYSKNIFDTKSISFGEGEEKFTFPIDPEAIKNVLFDTSKWEETQFGIEKNTDGTINKVTPKVENQMLTAAVALYGKKFLDEYAKHYKSLGGKKAIAPIQNAKPPEGTTIANIEAKPTTVAEAMAKSGRLVQNGF